MRLLVACALVAGCAGEATDPDPVADDIDVADPEIRTGNISEITITIAQPPGAAAPPPGQCVWSGSWTLNLDTGRFTGAGCTRGGRAVTRDRIMSAEPYGKGELVAYETMVRQLRRRRRASSCPTDRPLVTLDVVRRGEVIHYVDEITSCGSTAIPLEYYGIQGLAAAMSGA